MNTKKYAQFKTEKYSICSTTTHWIHIKCVVIYEPYVAFLLRSTITKAGIKSEIILKMGFLYWKPFIYSYFNAIFITLNLFETSVAGREHCALNTSILFFDTLTLYCYRQVRYVFESGFHVLFKLLQELSCLTTFSFETASSR